MSGNVQDRRGMGGGKLLGGGLGAAVLGLIIYFLGGDPSQILQGGGSPGIQTEQSAPAKDSMRDFVAGVLGSTEDVWHRQFEAMGRRYEEPTLVLFDGQVSSACGSASSATGPFYCPADKQVYLDLSFFREMKERFGAPGDFAAAYVIAHEVGHHVQNLLGISGQVQRAQQNAYSQAEANRLSVKLELQADFLAGLWAHHAQQMNDILEPGDLEEALNAAHAIGDDRLQQQSQGHVVPDAFTHGSSEQRAYWFRKGFQTGDFNQSNTFDSDMAIFQSASSSLQLARAGRK